MRVLRDGVCPPLLVDRSALRSGVPLKPTLIVTVDLRASVLRPSPGAVIKRAPAQCRHGRVNLWLMEVCTVRAAGGINHRKLPLGLSVTPVDHLSSRPDGERERLCQEYKLSTGDWREKDSSQKHLGVNGMM
ncbi:hypothetical protein DPEC_G00279730 [Dallia pectoralis]|uniref:Uncharacterized protein n=1 Tax=Dallia pectoralis TaxID=75939 RepID=A0ACC2FMC3_DALPE|nr:hypothetical protein DPEC_G00279730 [Dallia pectoralis]